jgi:hypothetical protein
MKGDGWRAREDRDPTEDSMASHVSTTAFVIKLAMASVPRLALVYPLA